MPRSKRILYDGAIYHIVQRGHNKGVLFKHAKDYNAFKDVIRKYKNKYTFEIYNYCFMPNHIHILLKIIVGKELPKIIHDISQSYSYYYKRRYDHAGYLYQNRYKSYIIENDSYLLECGRYIERNPVRADIVTDPSDWPFSSYNFYAKGNIDDIINVNLLYFTLGKSKAERQDAYKKYIIEPRPYESLIDEIMMV